MIIQVTHSVFNEQFRLHDRQDQFTTTALIALFEYYDDISHYELDVIALCCDWTEYTEKDLIDEYHDLDEKDDNDVLRNTLAYLEDKTTVIELKTGDYLVRNF